MINNEIWKPIENSDGYEISNMGRARSVLHSKYKVKARILKRQLKKGKLRIAFNMAERLNNYGLPTYR